MSTINIDLAADTILNVMIGQQDENEVREVVFDFSGWYTTYGSGTISLAIQRPKDEWPYEGTLTVDSTNHKATWEISETDTAYAGTGQIQLSYKVGDAKKKSVVYRFTCHKSLGALGSVVTPVQIQTFIDEVEEALQTMDGKLDDMEDEITDVKTDLSKISENTNLFTTSTNGYRLSTNGSNYEDEDYYVSDYIPVIVGHTYIKNSPVVDGYHCFATYDSSKTFVRVVNDSNSITIDNGEAFIRFSGLITEKPTAFLYDVDGITAKDNIARSDILGIQNNLQVDVNANPTLIYGKYINATNNTIGDSANFIMTDPIEVKKGQMVVLSAKGYNQVVGMIATCNSDNTSRTTVVASIDSDPHTYTYIVEEDGYIVCSFNKDGTHDISLIIDYYKYVEPLNDNIIFKGNETVNLGVGVDNSFINATNNHVNTSDNFKISNTIKLYKGQTLSVTAKGYKQVVGMICEYNDDDNSYITLVASIDSDTRTYSYTATKTIYLRCSYNRTVTPTYVIITPESRFIAFDDIESKIDTLVDPLSTIQYPQMFDNILCIGDSLTVGYDGSGGDPLTKNYPHFLEKLTVSETAIKAHGGWTAKQVWDNIISSATDLANYDCAIIFLGTNNGLTDTVEEDCDASDYTQNADTNTGCYGKIIGKIKADAPSCRIFCVAGVNDYIRRATAMNPAVRSLAEFYGVGLIDIENCIMSDNGSGSSAERYLYRPNDGIHYNALGYMTMANMMYDSMVEFMGNHRTMYDGYNSN